MLTYAEFVAMTLLSMGIPSITQPFLSGNSLQVDVGVNLKKNQNKNPILVVSYLPWNNLIDYLDIKPIYSFGISFLDRMAYISVGMRKEINVWKFTLIPSFSPTLYTSDFSKINKQELIQFRTGLELDYSVKHMAFGVGFYHISNAGITSFSAGQDVAYLSTRFFV